MAKRKFDYDVCLSFAGEDREYVERVAAGLVARGIKVFYDRYETANLWGKDLYTHLDDIYRKKAKYCVMFISRHYSKKLWTNHERKSVQARAFIANRDYILPARFDNTEIPGIQPTIGFVSLKGLAPETFCELVKSKLEEKRRGRRLANSPNEFRRIYFEGFDNEHLSRDGIKKRFGGIWLIGKRGYWTGCVTNSLWRLKNVAGPTAVLTNRIQYFEPAETPVDLGDCRVSVKVRIESPNDSHSGAGLVFRADPTESRYYAFLLHPGNSVSFAETTAGKMVFLSSYEIPSVEGRTFVTLKVIGRGPAIDLYVDDSLVHTVTEAKFRNGCPGTIGLSLGNFYFDDFSIHRPVR